MEGAGTVRHCACVGAVSGFGSTCNNNRSNCVSSSEFVFTVVFERFLDFFDSAEVGPKAWSIFWIFW